MNKRTPLWLSPQGTEYLGLAMPQHEGVRINVGGQVFRTSLHTIMEARGLAVLSSRTFAMPGMPSSMA
jgi:hypothetical protein